MGSVHPLCGCHLRGLQASLGLCAYERLHRLLIFCCAFLGHFGSSVSSSRASSKLYSWSQSDVRQIWKCTQTSFGKAIEPRRGQHVVVGYNSLFSVGLFSKHLTPLCGKDPLRWSLDRSACRHLSVPSRKMVRSRL